MSKQIYKWLQDAGRRQRPIDNITIRHSLIYEGVHVQASLMSPAGSLFSNYKIVPWGILELCDTDPLFEAEAFTRQYLKATMEKANVD